MKLEVTRIRAEAERVKSFELRSAGGEQLPEFTPGSHLVIQVQPDGRTEKRRYSILSDAADRTRYEIAVLCESTGRGGSRFMHDAVREGDLLEVSEPKNDFPQASHPSYSILIAGGIGITPIVAMLRKLVSDEASFDIHYAARAPESMAYGNEVERLAGDRATLYFGGRAGDAPLDLTALLSAPTDATHVYVCGPLGMIRAVRDIASKQGWRPEQIHFESFGGSAQPDDRPIRVELARSQMSLEVAASQSILDAMLEAGVWAQYECKRGECGMCMTPVLEGEPDHRDVFLAESDRERFMCTCVSRAKGDRLVLDL